MAKHAARPQATAASVPWGRIGAVLGLARLDADRLDPHVRILLEGLVEQLATAHATSAAERWRWFEDELRYDNARLPQALIVGAIALERDHHVSTRLETLGWLGDECGLADDKLRLPGHLGRHRSEPAPGQGDEQPLDAASLVEAELAAFSTTGEREHAARAQRAFDWFSGRNRLDRPLYDFASGGCSDGLGEHDLNANEGAESTLAFHRAELALDAAGLPVVLRRRLARPSAA